MIQICKSIIVEDSDTNIANKKNEQIRYKY